MKKSIYMMLVLILLLQCGGIFVYYGLKQKQVKFEMGEKLSRIKSGVEHFKISLEQFRKIKTDENEMVLNGKLYDIQSTSMTGDEIEINAVYDMAEEDVIAQINLTVQNNTKQNSHQEDHFVKLLTTVYLHSSFEKFDSDHASSQISFATLFEKLQSNKPDITSPPPRFV